MDKMTDDFFPGQDISEIETGNGGAGNVANVDASALQINFANIDENAGFEPLPSGVYSVTIGTMEAAKSKAGNPMISVTFNVMHPDYAKRKLFAHFVLNNDIALGRLKKFMLTVFPDISLDNVNLGEIIQSGIAIGRYCTVKVTQREYNGSMTNNVQDILPPAADAGFTGM